MSEIIAWTYRITDEHIARLNKPTTKLLSEIITIAREVDPPNLSVYRAVIYELGLVAISVISDGLVQACAESTKQLAKKLGLEPSP